MNGDFRYLLVPSKELAQCQILDPRILRLFPDILNICEPLCIYIYTHTHVCVLCFNSVLIIIIIIIRNLDQVFGQFICNYLLPARFIVSPFTGIFK